MIWLSDMLISRSISRSISFCFCMLYFNKAVQNSLENYQFWQKTLKFACCCKLSVETFKRNEIFLWNWVTDESSWSVSQKKKKNTTKCVKITCKKMKAVEVPVKVWTLKALEISSYIKVKATTRNLHFVLILVPPVDKSRSVSTPLDLASMCIFFLEVSERNMELMLIWITI